ncbi:MAG: transporter [Bryobacterales bacterium]|nr:transporter [Bryobacterales bacterium]
MLATASTSRKVRSANVTLAVLVAVNILNFYDRYILGVLAEPIRLEFHLTDTQLGFLGSVFIWLYAVVGLPLGTLADRWSRKKLLACGLGIWSVLTAMAAFATSYALLMCSRLGFAVGEAAVAPAATGWIGDLYPAEKRAKPLALFMMGVPLGAALTNFVSGSVAQSFGWRQAMILAAAPALLLIPMLLLLKETARGAAEATKPAKRGSVRDFLSVPTFWWIVASGALLNFNMYALSTFLPAFLGRIYHVTVAQSGTYAGFTYLLGGVSGSLIAGWLGDRAIRRGPAARMLFAAAFALAGAPLAWLGIASGGVVASVSMLTLFYGTLCSYYGFVYSSIQDIVAPSLRGTAMAVYFLTMYLCGASFGPVLTGKVSDLMARRAADAAGSPVLTEAFRAVGLQQAMFIMPVLSVLLAVVLYLGSRTISRDVERRQA